MRLSYSFLVLLLYVSISSALSKTSREIHKIVPLKSDGCLVIDTYKGSITITTHEKQQVEVHVTIESDDGESRNPKMDVEDTEIEIDGGENEVTVHTNYKNVERHHQTDFWDWIANSFESSNSLPLVYYTVKMPRTAQLRIKDYKSRTRIENVQSDIKFNTYKGEAEIESVFGGIDLETYKGTVHVSFSKIKHDSRFETYKGTITVAIPPKDNGFDLQTDFEKRVNFTTDFDIQAIERDKKHRQYDYRGSVNGGGPKLKLKSSKGNMRLKEK